MVSDWSSDVCSSNLYTDLSLATLLDANLSGADLRNANLSGADLRGAHLDRKSVV